MFLDALVNALNSSIFRYDNILTYLRSRGITEEEIRKYKIGYSKVISVPDDGTPDRARFMDEAWKGKKFENKIVFPLQDVLGRVIGIIGRSHETKEFKEFITEEAKYTGFFYGLFQAIPIAYETGKMYVVEGAFDLHAVAKIFPNTVGVLTAGLMEDQYQFLRMYVEKIITIFDSDKAGKEAAERASEWEGVYNVTIGYKDPSECLKRFSEKGFIEYIKKMENRVSLF